MSTCDCPRHGEIVEGVGNTSPNILVLGESPNSEDVLFNRPFSSRDGDLLRKCFTQAGIKPREIYSDFIVNCYLNDRVNAASGKFHIMRMHLKIGELKPKLILSLGKLPYRLLSCRKGNAKLCDFVGTSFRYKSPLHECDVYCWYHPNYILNASKEIELDSINFFKKVKNVLKN